MLTGSFDFGVVNDGFNSGTTDEGFKPDSERGGRYDNKEFVFSVS